MKETFESSFQRLEEILHVMNEGKASLDDSLKLFLEADTLINTCNKRLNEAEQKVQTLIKNRDGEVQLNSENTPATTPFQKEQTNVFEKLDDEVPF